MRWLLLGVMLCFLGGCSFHDFKNSFLRIIDRAPEVKIQPVPELSEASKTSCPSRTYILDKDGSIISATSVK
jgi:hypothetical protein